MTEQVDDQLVTVAEEALVVALIAATASAVAVGFVTWLLLRAADKPAGTMVTLSLAILTLAALAAYIVTRAEVMAAIIGTGIGALAGAVTYQLGGPHDTPDDGSTPPGPDGLP